MTGAMMGGGSGDGLVILGLILICGIVCCIGGCCRRRARASQTQWLAVPEGVSVGMQITTTWPDGRTVAVTVPNGATVGQRLRVNAMGEVVEARLTEEQREAYLRRSGGRTATRSRNEAGLSEDYPPTTRGLSATRQ